MNPFKDKFSLLLEQPEVSDEEAMGASLDQGTDPGAFDVAAPDPAMAQPMTDPGALLKQQNQEMTGTLQEWIGRLEEFTDYLNGLDPSSMQSQLNSAACDTLFNKIAGSETKKISRVAQDLRSVVESLKSYMLSNDDS